MLVVIINKSFPVSCPAFLYRDPRTLSPPKIWRPVSERLNDSSQPFHTVGYSELQGIMGPEYVASAGGVWSHCQVLGFQEGPISIFASCIQTGPGKRLPGPNCTTSAQSLTLNLFAAPTQGPQVEDSREVHAFLPSRVCLSHSTWPFSGPRADQRSNLLPGCQLCVWL